MLYIGLRHSCDESSHTESKHKHDSPLCPIKEHHSKDISRQVRRLVDQKLLPTYILTSPFLRCRMTAKLLAKELKRQTGTKVEVKVSVSLSRFFTSDEARKPDMTKETASYSPPLWETQEDFEKRLSKHFIKLARKAPPDTIIWGVTHALVITKMSFLADPLYVREHIAPLHAVTLSLTTA